MTRRAVSLLALAVDADQLGDSRLAVVNEDVAEEAVGVVGHDVGRERGEHDVASVSAQSRLLALSVRAPATGSLRCDSVNGRLDLCVSLTIGANECAF